MEPMEIVRRLDTAFPGEVLESIAYQGQVGVLVRRERIVAMMQWLRDMPEVQMNHLMDLCGVDNKKRQLEKGERFEVVYNLYSISHRHSLRIRAMIPENDPSIDSVTGVWTGANWHERECFDLFGITFNNHPDLRRILLPDDWEGFPLRKEYSLKGKKEWQGMIDLQEKVAKLAKYDFSSQQSGTDKGSTAQEPGEKHE